jgi:hypothetical protein
MVEASRREPAGSEHWRYLGAGRGWDYGDGGQGRSTGWSVRFTDGTYLWGRIEGDRVHLSRTTPGETTPPPALWAVYEDALAAEATYLQIPVSVLRLVNRVMPRKTRWGNVSIDAEALWHVRATTDPILRDQALRRVDEVAERLATSPEHRQELLAWVQEVKRRWGLVE